MENVPAAYWILFRQFDRAVSTFNVFLAVTLNHTLIDNKIYIFQIYALSIGQYIL